MSVFEVASSLRNLKSFRGVYDDISQAPLSDERPMSFLVYVNGWIAIVLQSNNTAIIFDPKGAPNVDISVTRYLQLTCAEHILFNIHQVTQNPVHACVELIRAKSRNISFFAFLRERLTRKNGQR